MYSRCMAVSNVTAAPPRSGGSRGPRFPKSQNGTSVQVSPTKGGVNLGTPTTCTSSRSASNLKTAYRGRY